MNFKKNLSSKALSVKKISHFEICLKRRPAFYRPELETLIAPYVVVLET